METEAADFKREVRKEVRELGKRCACVGDVLEELICIRGKMVVLESTWKGVEGDASGRGEE